MGRCDVVIAGAGNLGANLFDCMIGDDRWRVTGFIDDGKRGGTLLGLKIRGSDDPIGAGTKAIMAISSPQGRRAFVRALAPMRLSWVSYIDRRCYVSTAASLGAGTVVLPFATVGPHTRIGQFGCISGYAAVASGACLGDYVTLWGRASAASCTVGDGCQIGFNGACLDGAVLGDDVVVAPYAWVRKPVPSGALVIGHQVRRRPVPGDELS